ncbi:maleate cis-trans isomerase [Janibacter sp. Soil728]|uniref:maleate cis-trans isomerase family protein n=1 Tax=Janibacter sp. Soil728 TaxID=1736393 RepID=UPI0006FF77B4|nr:maleate cis-trans isomerase [Janibacter sp. Soil728]KRE39231.1 maleate cis-trans isomerase [Janibacter sp. Soil728]
MSGAKGVTAGIIYPDHAAEDEYHWAADLLGVHLPVTHVYGTDLHAVPELLDLGRPDRLAEGAAALAEHAPRSVIWACTSGSFVYGPVGAQQQIDQLASAAGVPASSTSAAFVDALAHLGLTRVAVAASYPEDVARLFVEYLAAAGVEVVAMSSAGIDTAAEVGALTPGQVVDLAAAHDHPEAQTLLVPDTAMRTLSVIPDLEARLGKPVLTANQVTIWQALRLAGSQPASSVLGSLFAQRQDHARQ